MKGSIKCCAIELVIHLTNRIMTYLPCQIILHILNLIHINVNGSNYIFINEQNTSDMNMY